MLWTYTHSKSLQNNNNNNNKAFDSNTRFLVCVTVMIQNPADGSFADRAHGTGSARRRRERQLRSWLRHERMTVRMELAAALHHSSCRGAGPETCDAPRSQMTANSREDSVYFDLFDEYTEDARPDRLVGVRPQERDQRHTVEQIVDTVLFAPSLDVPVPQMDNQLVEVCRPRYRLHPVVPGPVCASLSRRQNIWWKYRRSSPILLCCSGLWSRTSIFQLVVEGETSVFKVFLPRQRSTAHLASQERSSERIVEQFVDSRVLGGGLQDFHPFQGSSASSSSSREHAGEGVFRTLPRRKKKSEGKSALRVGTECGL